MTTIRVTVTMVVVVEMVMLVGLVVVSIQKICYLFATAERFKKCAKSGY